MENYTKYKLISNDELASVLDGKDNLFVIACNKCFKEFETVDEPDCDEFLKFAADQGKNVTGSAKFDFLCNKMHTERKLQDLIPEGTENVVVISCGLGIQTVAAVSYTHLRKRCEASERADPLYAGRIRSLSASGDPDEGS